MAKWSIDSLNLLRLPKATLMLIARFWIRPDTVSRCSPTWTQRLRTLWRTPCRRRAAPPRWWCSRPPGGSSSRARGSCSAAPRCCCCWTCRWASPLARRLTQSLKLNNYIKPDRKIKPDTNNLLQYNLKLDSFHCAKINNSAQLDLVLMCPVLYNTTRDRFRECPVLNNFPGMVRRKLCYCIVTLSAALLLFTLAQLTFPITFNAFYCSRNVSPNGDFLWLIKTDERPCEACLDQSWREAPAPACSERQLWQLVWQLNDSLPEWPRCRWAHGSRLSAFCLWTK